MIHRKIFLVSRLLKLNYFAVAIIAWLLTVLLSFGVNSFVHFIDNVPSPKRILVIIYCLILVLGLTGASRSLAELFGLGVEGYRKRYLNRFREIAYDFDYEKVVRQTADSFILFGGALLFLWLL
jgi:hypothetical protein